MRAPLLLGLLLGLLLPACKSAAQNEVLASTQGGSSPYKVQFEGNESIPSGSLLSVIALDLEDFEKSGFQEPFIDDAAFQLTLHYKSLGYPFVEDSYTLEQRAEGPLATFRIQEGPRVLLTDIDCVCVAEEAKGEKPLFTRDETRAFFEGPRTGALERGDLLFLEDNVDGAVGKARSAFLSRGYLDVKVEPPTVTFSEERTRASVKMRITQGQRYFVGKVELSPESRLPDGLEEKYEELVAQARMKDGERRFFTQRGPYELRAALGELMANSGYPDNQIEVKSTIKRESARAHLEITVQTGGLVTVGGVKFVGCDTSNAHFLKYLRSRIVLEKGETFNNVDLRESVSRLYETTLFSKVNVSLEETDAATRDLVVELQESPTLETYIEPGFGSYELFRLGAGIRERNWRHTGLQLRSDVTVGQRALRAEAGLRDPWFLQRELMGDLTFSFDRRDEPSFSSGGTGVGAFVTKRWTRRNWTTFGYQFRDSTIDDVDVVESEVEDDAVDDVKISSVRLTQRYDRRNHPFLPSSGVYAEAAVEQAGRFLGSEFKFTRLTGSFSGYKEFREGTVLASALRTGVIVPNGNTVPLQERFYNGGENSVRSYKESELGPKDSDDNPIGGEAFTTLSVELRQRISPRFQLAGFFDAGNVTPDHEDYFKFEGVGSAVGVGLRYILPIGPLRLDLGVNPDPNKDEDDYVLQFAVGMAF